MASYIAAKADDCVDSSLSASLNSNIINKYRHSFALLDENPSE